MDANVMFFEFDRLTREELQEVIMPTEGLPCSGCRRWVEFTAKEGEPKMIECPHCGKQYMVLIEVRKKTKKVA